jgi:hypothetical protein
VNSRPFMARLVLVACTVRGRSPSVISSISNQDFWLAMVAPGYGSLLVCVSDQHLSYLMPGVRVQGCKKAPFVVDKRAINMKRKKLK